jgi:CubicO group peptidase (beta-lactamase class C family)
VLLAAVLGAAVGPAGCGADDGHRPLATFVDDVMPEGSTGTFAAAIDGELVTCRGWGHAEGPAEAAPTCDTVYDVMSMTKQFTAAAVLKLQMQGRLHVGDRIGAYLDGVPADKRAITIHQLLTNTSGLVDVLGGDYEVVSRAAFVATAMASRLEARPGAHYEYSNAGYSLLAAIVEEASGTSYERYLAANLFEPAGMASTGYVLPDWDPAQVAVEHDEDGAAEGRPYDHPWADDGPYWNLRGNGGMLSTARDMYRWHVALEGDRILDDAAKEQLFEPWVREEPDGDTFYGYGWVIEDTDRGTVQWHNGGNDWSYGEIARLPAARAMVFWVTNRYRSTSPAWDLEELGPTITEGALSRLLDHRG